MEAVRVARNWHTLFTTMQFAGNSLVLYSGFYFLQEVATKYEGEKMCQIKPPTGRAQTPLKKGRVPLPSHPGQVRPFLHPINIREKAFLTIRYTPWGETSGTGLPEIKIAERSQFGKLSWPLWVFRGRRR